MHLDLLSILFCFVFRLCAFVEAAALRSIVLRYTGVPIATRVSLFSFISFIFCLFGEDAFSEYVFRFLFVWTIEYVVRFFLPDGVFSTL